MFEEKGMGKNYIEATQKILALIKEDSYITRKELAEKIGITEDGVKYHLSNLKKSGRLKRIGPDKGERWEVV